MVMGFFVLAAMLKYLYSLDAVLQTGFLTRERFPRRVGCAVRHGGILPAGICAPAGISRDTELGVVRLLIGTLCVVFGLSLMPGTFGGQAGRDRGVYSAAGERNRNGDLAWVENDLPSAFAAAKAQGKTCAYNFTGYACTNCHWMKANMFTKPEIAGVMKNMVLVDLYTDGDRCGFAGESEAGRVVKPWDYRRAFLCLVRCESERDCYVSELYARYAGLSDVFEYAGDGAKQQRRP